MDKHVNETGISWGVLAIILGIMVPIIVGAIQLGAVRNQVEVNSDRLSSLEKFRADFDGRNEGEDARIAALERQLADVVRNGSPVTDRRLAIIEDRLKIQQAPK